MPQMKPPRSRIAQANTRKGASRPVGIPAATPRRRSPRLLSQAEHREDVGPVGVAAATPRRRSPRLHPVGEESGGGRPECNPTFATPCRRSTGFLSRGGHHGGLPGMPGSRRGEEDQRGASPSTRARQQPLKIPSDSEGTACSEKTPRASTCRSRKAAPGMEESRRRHPGTRQGICPGSQGFRRSLRLSKSASDGGIRFDDDGRSRSEGHCRRRSARLMGSVGTGLKMEVGVRHTSEETGRSVGREGEMKKNDVFIASTSCTAHVRKCGKDVPSTDAAESLRRAEVVGTVSEESRSNVVKEKDKKKRKISAVVSTTKRGRDEKRRQTMGTQELALHRSVLSGACSSGWTNEQEVALRKAYILAKPSPHFWKKVSKMVPGKSAQDCFDRMHSKIVTPVPAQPRSRPKMIEFSPLGFSDLFNNNAKRPKSSRKKNLLAHKTVRHILRKHSVMDHGQEADLFSVLETSPSLGADFSHINVPSNPEHTMESPEVFRSSNENLSSSHKKMLSRFKSPVQTYLTSPEVLKPVRNIKLHEKYIDQLHCREARRRTYAKADRSFNSEDDKENAVLKGDVVKAARNALKSEAREMICQLGRMQATSSDNSEDTKDNEDECEEETSTFTWTAKVPGI